MSIRLKRDIKKNPSYKAFRRDVAPRQSMFAAYTCCILIFFSLYYLFCGVFFGTMQFVKKTHILIMYAPIGILSLIMLIAIIIIGRNAKKHWKALEVMSYLIFGILPYWGLLIMNISVIEGRQLNFLIWIIGMLVASGGFYLAPPFSATNLVIVTLLTAYSMQHLNYSFGANGMKNLIALAIICIWIAILRFMDGYSEYRKNEELAEAVAEADQANKAKGTFLMHMSHEIRTPINAVLGNDELILRESKDPQITAYANNIKTSGNMLLSLINDILDFSKIDAGRMKLISNSYHLSSTLQDMINSVYVRIKDKGLELKLQINEHTPVNLYGDEIRVKQIILNLLTNAVKYTPSGTITLSVDFRNIAGSMIDLIISVQDTGIGIKEEDIAKLTQDFERIEESRNRSIEGTGLGMSITAELLKLMSGKMEVKSKYNIGSCFTVHIPQEKENNAEIGTYAQIYEEAAAATESYAPSFKAPDAKILIVDDNRTNRVLARELLRETEIKIDLAESGVAFLEKAQKNHYDIIFVDHLMPEMDGVEALGKLKEKVDCSQTVMIALTANAVKGAKEFYLEAGFDDFLPKPIEPIKYEKMVRSYLPENLMIQKESHL